MRKVAKIGLKGTDKEFCINYKDTKHGICVEIKKHNYIKEPQVECWSPTKNLLKSQHFDKFKFYSDVNRKFDNVQ
jgi:hypothetical protein